MSYFRDVLRYRSEEWADSIQLQRDGWSPFLHQCKREVVAAIGPEATPEKVERRSADGESSFMGTVPGGSKRFWIYTDGAQAEGYGTLEHWDFESPSQLISNFIKQISGEMQSNKSLNSDAGKAGAG